MSNSLVIQSMSTSQRLTSAANWRWDVSAMSFLLSRCSVLAVVEVPPRETEFERPLGERLPGELQRGEQLLRSSPLASLPGGEHASEDERTHLLEEAVNRLHRDPAPVSPVLLDPADLEVHRVSELRSDGPLQELVSIQAAHRFQFQTRSLMISGRSFGPFS